MKWTPILGAVALAAGSLALQGATAATRAYTYAVTHPRYGPIGTFTQTIADTNGVIRAETHLRVAVKILGLVAYRENADETEVWRDRRLESIRSVATVNGHNITVTGQARGDRFMITSPSGTTAAPADVAASDPWALQRMGPALVVSTRSGEVDKVDVTGGEADHVLVHGVSTLARHFHVRTANQPNKWEVWIDAHGVPVKFRSLEGGSPVDFTLVSSPS